MTAYNCTFYMCLQADAAVATNGGIERRPVAEPWEHTQGDGVGSLQFIDIHLVYNVAALSNHALENTSVLALGQTFQPIIKGELRVSIGTGEALPGNESQAVRATMERAWFASGSLANVTAFCKGITDRFQSGSNNKTERSSGTNQRTYPPRMCRR
jgi:hypothetical protein